MNQIYVYFLFVFTLMTHFLSWYKLKVLSDFLPFTCLLLFSGFQFWNVSLTQNSLSTSGPDTLHKFPSEIFLHTDVLWVLRQQLLKKKSHFTFKLQCNVLPHGRTSSQLFVTYSLIPIKSLDSYLQTSYEKTCMFNLSQILIL